MRFAVDARFKRPLVKEVKLELDDRFKDVLKNEFYEQAPVDKYGREAREETDFIKAHFEYDVEEEEEQCQAVVEEEVEVAEEVTMAIAQEEIEFGEITNRIAVVHIDWDHIKAQDIFVLMNSFTKEKDELISVSIYTSEFGKQRMAHEELHGPPKEIYNDAAEDVENPFNMVELRKYQLERMRYYFCICVFKNKEIAKHIFNQCDGQELELTSNALDLRFVPNDVTFDTPIHDQCNATSAHYEPLQFETKSLQHSNIKLTWDKDQVARQNKIQKIHKGDLEHVSDLIASCSEDEMVLENVKSLTQVEQPHHKEETVLNIQFQPQLSTPTTMDMSESDDDDDDLQHFDMRQVMRHSKAKQISKWKKRKVEKLVKRGKITIEEANEMTGKIQDTFEINVKDPRFESMFNDPEYHIDQLDSKFMKTQNTKEMLKEIEKKRK